MKLAILWLLLVAGALALISAVASYDPGHTDPSIVVVGERSEIPDPELPQLEDATFVETLDDLPSPLPSMLFLSPNTAAALPNDALKTLARKGVAVGGLNLTLDDIARLNGTTDQRRLFADALREAGIEPETPPEPPFWSLSWISCGIIAGHDLTPSGRGEGGTFDGPFGRRSFESAFAEMRALGDQCRAFDPANIPPPSYRIVVIGTSDVAETFATPALHDAVYVNTAEDVPFGDVALVLVTPAGAEASTRYEPEPLTILRNSGVPLVGLDVDLADLLELSGVIAAIRGASAQAADDYFASAQWQGERPVYSYISRSCPLDDPREGGQGQAWIGGLGATPEEPPLRTFATRIDELREIGANCIDILRRQQLAYIDSLHGE